MARIPGLIVVFAFSSMPLINLAFFVESVIGQKSGSCPKTSGDACQLFWKDPNDAMSPANVFEFDDTTLVQDLMDHVHNVTGIPREELVLSTTRPLMENMDATLRSLNVEDLSTVKVTLRLLGGISGGVNIPWTESANWIAKVSVTRADGAQELCTGAIYKHHVLTAAHCFNGVRDMNAAVQVKTADNNIYWAIRSVVHSDWVQGNSQQQGNDVAVIQLDREYQPAQGSPMPVFLDKHPTPQVRKVRAFGFGDTDASGKSHLFDQSGFVKSVVLQTYNTVGKNMFCRNPGDSIQCAGSGPKSIDSTCAGDSGGPWLLEPTDRVVITGVTSFGSHTCAHKAKSSAFTMIGYPRVKDWILNNADSFKLEPEN